VEVIVFVEDVAASGGYWLACTGSRIYASRSEVLISWAGQFENCFAHLS